MSWVDGHYNVVHPREPWDADTPPILVHSPLEQMRGKKRTPAKTLYDQAKYRFDMQAAETIVQRCLSKATMDSIVAHTIALGLDARLLIPHPAFDDDEGGGHVSNTSSPRNALPFAYAGFLKSQLGCPVDEEIVQIARVGRTKLNRWPRFLFQPSFGGAVRPGNAYILVDDVVSTGGTFAALRSYVTRNGGRAIFATALASTSGKNQPFAITKQTVNHLEATLGHGLNDLWTETVGHGIGCLTEAEGQFLGTWADDRRKEGCEAGDPLLQRLRDRLDEAATTCG